MNIAGIDMEYVELFSLSYTTAEKVFNIEPSEAPPKLQHKIRKWVSKNYMSGTRLPGDVMKYTNKAVSDEYFIEFLRSCFTLIKEKHKAQKEKIDRYTVSLDTSTKEAIETLFQEKTIFGDDICRDRENIKLCVDDSPGYCQSLILHKASELPLISNNEYDYLIFKDIELNDSKYVLTGDIGIFDEDKVLPFSISCADIKLETKVYKADEMQLYASPWDNLSALANVILDKFTISDEFLNNKEKELLPLVVEICKLFQFTNVPEEPSDEGFPVLKAYINKHRYNHLSELLEKAEKHFRKKKNRPHILSQLYNELNNILYEPLWRELYGKFTASQADYPSKVREKYADETLRHLRKEITQLLHHHGYTGEYPDFIKTGSIARPRLAHSYETIYIVGNEKNARFHIHCSEVDFNGHLMVEFLCGTELLHNGETAGDIYSCTFNAKGRRIFNSVLYEHKYAKEGEIASDNLSERVGIAVKKAQLIKLTKEERTSLGETNPVADGALFLSVFIIMGGLFGVFMTLGLMLVSILIATIFGLVQEIPSLFADMPWWLVFLASWGMFGITMGVLTLLAKRK